MKVVYANGTFYAGGFERRVDGGSHWPADDPLVLANPSYFSDDPRWGLSFSVEPVEEEVSEKRRPGRPAATPA